MNNSTPAGNFYGLGIAPGLLQVIEKLKFTTPTPIQAKAIPIAIEGKDLIGIAQTGAGKTLAFCVPMLMRLARNRNRGLVLAPTRELAIQINETFVKFAAASGLESVVLIGGESMTKQITALRRRPRIVIATPGRLLDHIGQHRARLDDVSVLVLDEADRMLDMGFAPQIDRIIRLIPRDRQTMLFSATMPTAIVKMASANMRLPVRTEIAPTGTTAEKVSQEIFIVKSDWKERLLVKILAQYQGPVLLFTRTKRGAKKITRCLRQQEYAAAEIHADRSLSQRKEALSGFKAGRYRILAATDIAARGIDVTGIQLVINYDLPDDPENYVHRIGRTGRAGLAGHAISFATPDQKSDVHAIEKIIRATIPTSQHPEMPAEQFAASAPPARSGRGFRGAPARRGFGRYGHPRRSFR